MGEPTVHRRSHLLWLEVDEEIENDAHTLSTSTRVGRNPALWFVATELSIPLSFGWNIYNSSCTSTRYMVVGEYTNYLHTNTAQSEVSHFYLLPHCCCNSSGWSAEPTSSIS